MARGTRLAMVGIVCLATGCGWIVDRPSASARADLRVAKTEEILKFVPTGARLAQTSDVAAHSSSFPSAQIPTSAQLIFTTDRDPSNALRQYIVEAPKWGWSLATIDCSQSLGRSTISLFKTVRHYLLELEVEVIRYEGNRVHATIFPSRGVQPPKTRPVLRGVLRTDPGCLTKVRTAPKPGTQDPRWPGGRVCASVAHVWPDTTASSNDFGDICVVTFRGGTMLSLHATRNGRAYALGERVSAAGDDTYFATGLRDDPYFAAAPRDVVRAAGFWVRVKGVEVVADVTLPADSGLPEQVLLAYARDLQNRFGRQ